MAQKDRDRYETEIKKMGGKLPKSMKDREKIDIVLKQLGNGGEEDLLSLIQIRLEKKLGVSVIPNKRYAGAGYAFDIDTEKLFNKL